MPNFRYNDPKGLNDANDPVTRLIASEQYRDIPANIPRDYYAGRITSEQAIAQIQRTPVFNPNIGPQINTGQGVKTFQPGTPGTGFNPLGQGIYTPEILQNAINSIRSRAANIVPFVSSPSGGAAPFSTPAGDTSKDQGLLDTILGSVSLGKIQSGTGRPGEDAVNKLLSSLLGGTAAAGGPALPTAAESRFAQFSENEGLNAAESELNAANENLRTLENTVLTQADKFRGQPGVTTAFINRQLVKLDADTAAALRDARTRVSSATDRYNTAQKTVEMLMRFSQQDYENARQQYNDQFSRNFQLIKLLQDAVNDEQADARAKLKVITDGITAGNLSPDDLSSSDWLNINKLEIKAYNGTGIVRLLQPGEKELDTYTDQNNNRVVVFYNPATKENRNIIVGKEKVTGAVGVVPIAGETGGLDNRVYYNALNQAAVGSSNQARVEYLNNLGQLLAAGDEQQAREYVVRIATSNAGAELQTKALGRLEAISALDTVKNGLQEYVQKTGDTNILRGTAEQAANKLGLTTDPRLQFIHNQIRQAFINYRRSMTGVAFSPEESAQYEQIFPRIQNVEEMNMPIIDSLLLTMNRNQKLFLGFLIGSSNYEQLFEKNIQQPLGGTSGFGGSGSDIFNTGSSVDVWLQQRGL